MNSTMWTLAAVLLVALAACADETEQPDPRTDVGDGIDAGDVLLQADTAAVECPSPGPTLGLSFPPVSSPQGRALTMDKAAALHVGLIRMAEHWNLREDAQGIRNWQPLLDRLDDLDGMRIMLTIEALAPDRYCEEPPGDDDVSCVNTAEGLTAFDSYVRELLSVVGDRIEILQYANEWTSAYHFKGDAEDFIAAYTILDAAVADSGLPIKVVPGGLATSVLRGMAACRGGLDSIVVAPSASSVTTLTGAELTAFCSSAEAQAVDARIIAVLGAIRYDLFDMHLYDVETEWEAIEATLRSAPYNVTGPIIASEFGGPNAFYQDVDPQSQADALDRYLTVISGLDLQVALFFQLVESPNAHPSHVHSGLLDGDINDKPAFEVFARWSNCLNP